DDKNNINNNIIHHLNEHDIFTLSDNYKDVITLNIAYINKLNRLFDNLNNNNNNNNNNNHNNNNNNNIINNIYIPNKYNTLNTIFNQIGWDINRLHENEQTIFNSIP